ncbi:hypothetical protein [Arcobacter sp. LA11]|uniref:hypothetical protein n=1 Tax=Arcobacter sp. LA11 TaxID=1898176 RepID=UPI00093268AE|nr:hypothetical protein [Arcobacter sp. LA11]
MKIKNILLLIFLLFGNTYAWEAKVTDILHHDSYAAIRLSPDPGPGNCTVGSPYLLKIDDTIASKQKFNMLLSALISGKIVKGFSDSCSTAIWGTSRPTLYRLYITNRN